MTWITFDHVFDGQTLHADCGVEIEGGIVTGLSPGAPQGPRQAGTLSPGFVDLQVNGGGGVMLNSTPTASAMDSMAAAHRHFGTTAILPTVITDTPEVLIAAADAAIEAKGHDGLMGLHIEGPHISVARRGTHAASAVRPLDDLTRDTVARLRKADLAVMITLAPEAVDPFDIAALAATGAVVSLGHTDATAEQVEAAIAAGASCGTHLFNAMSPMTSRAPGAVGAILNAGLHFGIICDGHHVDDRMIGIALRASTRPDRAFLVSDAMATVGGPESFDLYGQPVRLQGGKLINTEGGLAGAHFTQTQGAARLVKVMGLPLERALQMTVTTPAELMQRSGLSELTNRPLADLIVLDSELAVQSAARVFPQPSNQFSAAE